MVLAFAFVSLLGTSPDAGISHGALSKTELYAVIKRGQADIKGCYEQAARLPGPCIDRDWKVTASWTIARDGSVAGVNVQNNSRLDSLRECIRVVISRWQFPKPRGGTIDVTFPWMPKIGCEDD